jgi:hypothetical protein
MDADRTPSLLQRCWVDGKQPSGKTKDLYDSAVQKLLDELGLGLLDASTKSERHEIMVCPSRFLRCPKAQQASRGRPERDERQERYQATASVGQPWALGHSGLANGIKSESTAPTDRRTDCAEKGGSQVHQCRPHR